MRNKLRWWMSNAIMLGLAVAFLVHFTKIALYGRIIIQEPNPIILSFEIAGLVAVVVFALLNFIKLWRI